MIYLGWLALSLGLVWAFYVGILDDIRFTVGTGVPMPALSLIALARM